MRKTLGGDRLGAGKKMQVDLHGYERSTHDLGNLFRTTMSPGTIVPCYKKIALPGDTWDIDLNALINTHPTLGPLFASFKFQIDVSLTPIRLYNAQLHNNKLKIGLDMAKIKLPTIEMDAPELDPSDPPSDINNSQINPSCIFKYCGISGIGTINASASYKKRVFNALFWLVYWDFYKNYYANKQEEIGAVIHNEAVNSTPVVSTITVGGNPIAGQTVQNGSQLIVTWTATVGTPESVILNTNVGGISLAQLVLIDTTALVQTFIWPPNLGSTIVFGFSQATPSQTIALNPTVVTFPLDDIDTMRERILGVISNSPFSVTAQDLFPYKLAQQEDNGFFSQMGAQEGLAIKTYQNDLFNNWLQTEWIDGTDGISAVTAIDTSGGSFTIDTLNLSKKLYDMLNRIAVSGGTYDDWIEVQWAHEHYRRAETPMYMGGLSKEIVFQEVVSNSSGTTDNESTQPLGTLGGKGTFSQKHKGGSMTIKVEEPSIIMAFCSITPRIDYSQGNDFDTLLQTMDDLHKPAMDGIGFQDLITDQLAFWDTTQEADSSWTLKSAGKQPAWINWMTSVNKSYGNFAIENNEMFMTLNRRYESEVDSGRFRIKDLTTYIDPVKFNQIFAQTSLDAMNFWVQIAIDATVRRKMSAKLMPNV